MLVLSRKKNESIIIDDRIKIVVVEVRGDKVRLGVEAPQLVPVHRQEVYDAIQRERNSPCNQEAESTNLGSDSKNSTTSSKSISGASEHSPPLLGPITQISKAV